ANNSIGGSGVAPDATLISYRIGFLENWQESAAVIAFQKALASKVDVVNNSWGTSVAYAYGPTDPSNQPLLTDIANIASQGRGGNGSIVVFSNGNDGARNFDSNLNNVLNDRHVIAVGALDDTGVRSAYSTPGANVLISAPGGASIPQLDTQPGNGVLTTD